MCLPFLIGEHFNRLLFVNRGEVDLKDLVQIVEDEKPDIVIEEIVERSLMGVENILEP
jgi:hypothetical protein